MLEDKTEIIDKKLQDEIEVDLEYFLEETLESLDVLVVENMLMEALGLFKEVDNGNIS